ncbi:hypothetical protein ACP70R_044345 [Stipagrostis hirtigluma subsp. patula]
MNPPRTPSSAATNPPTIPPPSTAMDIPRAPPQPPFYYDEVPPDWPADLPPPITCPGRPLRYFLPRAVVASFPPRAAGGGGVPDGCVPLQLTRTWLMLLGLPEHLSSDESVEEAIANFAALVRVDKSHEPVSHGVRRHVCEVLVADLSEVPHVLAVSQRDDPLGREWDVTVVLLRRDSDAGGDEGKDGADAGGRRGAAGDDEGKEKVLGGNSGEGKAAEASG